MKLNQIIAIEKGIKTRCCATISDLYKKIQKPDLFNGFTKTYRAKNEEDEVYPSENKNIQYNTNEIINQFNEALIELFNVTADKDFNNCNACADIKIGNNVIAGDVPATYILFLEKQFKDIKTFIEALPELDQSEDWKIDVNSEIFKTELTTVNKTKKIQKAIVLYEATEKHPAQTQLISVDETIGYWDTIKKSGAISKINKNSLIKKINEFTNALKIAREEANNYTVEERNKIGEKIFKYIFD